MNLAQKEGRIVKGILCRNALKNNIDPYKRMTYTPRVCICRDPALCLYFLSIFDVFDMFLGVKLWAVFVPITGYEARIL